MSSLGWNCGGKYIWKINPFSRLLQDARDGKITSLESPPIYTSQQEYKFFMHVFPKGVNSGDGRHIGIFVGMMQGEYDTILEWPFCGRIVFTFKDQSTYVNGFRHDISDTFMANRNLSAFQEPTAAGQYSTLYGYAEFALTALVCSPPYFKDDTVMIVIEIHNNTSTFPCKEAQRLGCKNSMN